MKKYLNKLTIILAAVVLPAIFTAAESFAVYRLPSEVNPYYHYLMGRILIYEGKVESGIGRFEIAAHIDRDNLTLKWELMELYYITAEYEKALNYAGQIYSADPKNTKLLDIMADIYDKTGDPEKSLKIFNEITAIEPGNNLN